jgi:hypothetical protein
MNKCPTKLNTKKNIPRQFTPKTYPTNISNPQNRINGARGWVFHPTYMALQAKVYYSTTLAKINAAYSKLSTIPV